MKNLILLVVIISASISLSAQHSNALYGEILGNGLLGSINYDFAPAKNHQNFRVKIGLGAVAGPVIITQGAYLIGKERHFVEAGLGFTSLIYEDRNNDWTTDVVLSGALQYRFESRKGFLLRIGFAPTFIPSEDNGDIDITKALWFFPGLSLGYAF